MPAYMVVAVKPLTTEGWEPYQTRVAGCIAEHGGRYLAKRADVELLEGAFPYARLTIFQFPSMDAIRAFWNSEAYRSEIRPLRDGLGIVNVWAVPGCAPQT